jgi:protein TonB
MVGHLFRDVVEPSFTIGDSRAYTVPVSIAAHALIIAAALLVPLLVTDSSMLPTPSAMLAFIAAAPLPAPPAAPPRVAAAKRPQTMTNPDAAPLQAQHGVTPEGPIPVNRDLLDGVENSTGVVPGGGVEHFEAPPPLPVRPADKPAPEPVRLSSGIQGPTKIKDVPPTYPRVAQAARVQGVVIIEATIGPTGRVQDARILRSIPLLDAAALEAVRQWQYAPTLLNGVPVSVLMTITVNFTLR